MCIRDRDKSFLLSPITSKPSIYYIEGFEVIGDNKKDLSITLKYYKGSPLINKIEKITKQGCRVYSSVEEIPKTIGGLGTTILSTSKGVLSDSDARNQKVGGEVLISVF